VKDEHVKDAAQDVAEGAAEDVPQDVAHDLASVPGQRSPSSPRHHRRRRRLCAARAEMGAQLGSSVAFGSGCGQALPGVRFNVYVGHSPPSIGGGSGLLYAILYAGLSSAPSTLRSLGCSPPSIGGDGGLLIKSWDLLT